MTTLPRLHTVRGRVLAPDPVGRRLVDWPDAVVHIDDHGTITEVVPARADDDLPETWPGAVILPGFVDAHLHYPQTRILGSASGPLLPWLKTSVFPEEARFADHDYAKQVAIEFCAHLVEQGTTLAAIYSSAHPEATQCLLQALDQTGLRAVAGLTLMDRHAPSNVLLAAEPALAAVEDLVQTWHGHDVNRLTISVNPRFAISCTPTLLREAGRLAQRERLLLQTHIAENPDEGVQTAALYPHCRDYLDVYEAHDCLGSHSVFAHAIHFSEDEWARVQRADAAVIHCPDSNFFLGSGCMPLRDALDRGIRVGLGSDVGAGRTFSMRRVAAAAYDAALIRNTAVNPEELLWLATRGGAVALGQAARVGCIAPGFEADFAVVDVPSLPKAPLIDALLFRHDAGPVRATIVRGRCLHA